MLSAVTTWSFDGVILSDNLITVQYSCNHFLWRSDKNTTKEKQTPAEFTWNMKAEYLEKFDF